MTWQTGPSLTLARSSACAVTVDNHLYAIGGGWSDAATALTTVEYAVAQPDGQLSAWTLTARMTTPRVFLACAVLHGYLYAIGGEQFIDRHPVLLRTVERAPILPDGHLGLWETASPLTTPRRAAVALALNDHLYVIGGYNGTFLRTIEYASLRPNGTLGPWQLLTGRTILPRYVHAGIHRDSAVYLIGGHDETSGAATNRTEWTRLLATGQFASWQEGPLLVLPRFLSAAVIVENRLYLFGGSTGREPLASIERAVIHHNGALDSFTVDGALSSARSGMAVATYGRTVYLIGGLVEGQATPAVEYATFTP